MRLWIDGQCLQTASRTRGIGRYVLEFVRAIAETHANVELVISFNAELAEEAVAARRLIEPWVNPSQIHVWQGTAKAGEALLKSNPGRRISEIALLHHVRCLAPDVALCASPFEGMLDCAVPFLPDAQFGVPSATIFFDAIPARFEDRYLQSALSHDAYYRRLAHCGKFDLCLCISDFVNREANELIPNVRSVNIGAGLSRNFQDEINRDRTRRSVAPNEDFVLYVGGLDWRKNVNLIPQAFEYLSQGLRESLKFVVAGDHRDTDFAKIRATWSSRGLNSDNLLHVENPSDSDLVDLYTGAKALLLPSFMEGFGLTALEAMACGTPVAVARTSAMPEVVGNDALMFDPSSPEQLATCLMKIFQDPEFLEFYKRRNLSKAKQFSWERTASLAVDALTDLKTLKPAEFHIHDYRRISSEKCRSEKLDLHLAANILARSEPIVFGSPRLIIDATATMQVDYKTGIQRVVNKICDLIDGPENGDEYETVVSFSDDNTGWYRVSNGVHGTAVKREENRLFPGPSDRILMLDSSWDLHATHRKFLASAQARGCRIISCLYDTVPLKVPAFCDPAMPNIFSQWFQNALQISTGFVCISKAVADELHGYLEALHFPRPMNIGYWHLGADFSKLVPPENKLGTKFGNCSPTFLMVGTLEPRKGHGIALDAFDKLWSAGIDINLTIAGGHGWGIDHFVDRMMEHPEYKKRLHWYNAVDDQKLASLYRNSDALIAASYAEGFGLPIVEANRCGLPAIVSDIPVFREIAPAPHMVNFFDVGSAQSLSETILNFMNRQSSRSATLPAATGSKSLSWADSARQLRKVVIGDNWHRVYKPPQQNPFASHNDIGKTRMTAVIKPEERNYSLDLVEGPYRNSDNTALKVIVCLTSSSHSSWSSNGHDGDEFGIYLGISRISGANTCSQEVPLTTRFPFLIVPGEQYYFCIEVPDSCKRAGSGWVDIDIMQKGTGWFERPLRVTLEK